MALFSRVVLCFVLIIMELNLGPIALRHYSGKGWSFAEIAFITAKNGGLARRESAVHAAFKSEHLTEMLGQENPNDKFIAPDGTVYYGKVHVVGGAVNVISAEQVFAAKARAAAINAADKAQSQPEPEPQAVAV